MVIDKLRSRTSFAIPLDNLNLHVLNKIVSTLFPRKNEMLSSEQKAMRI